MPATILTVDDDPSFLRTLRHLLGAESDVRLIGEARNGEEAVQQAAGLKPDVIIMDISMPVVNGFDATRRIKNIRPESKVIICSVHSEVPYELAAIENGADGFLTKKRLGTDLIPRIRQVLGTAATVKAEEKIPLDRPVSAPDNREIKKPISVLIVDDNPDFLELTADLLRRHEEIRLVGCSTDGTRGIKLALELRPDVIVMDLDMPDFLGFEAMLILRNKLPQVGLIALTVFEPNDYQRSALSATADVLVCKARIDTELVPAIQRLAALKENALS